MRPREADHARKTQDKDINHSILPLCMSRSIPDHVRVTVPLQASGFVVWVDRVGPMPTQSCLSFHYPDCRVLQLSTRHGQQGPQTPRAFGEMGVGCLKLQ